VGDRRPSATEARSAVLVSPGSGGVKRLRELLAAAASALAALAHSLFDSASNKFSPLA
jgi:hypothetical protein